MVVNNDAAVFVYVSCSETKRANAVAHLTLGEFTKARDTDALETIMGRWRHAIDVTDDANRVRAIELYGGGIWRKLRTEEKKLRESGVQVRIVSAGLGLCAPDDLVPAYDATFAPGNKNSIGRVPGAKECNRVWWRLLSEWDGGWSGPRSLYAAVRRYPDAAHVIALPTDYLDAVLEDMLSIMNDESCMRRTVVLVAPSASVGRHFPRAVQIPGDLYGALGGTRGTVLARAGLFLASKLNRNVTDPAAIAKALRPLHAKSKPLPIRVSQTNAKISQFIRAALRKDPCIGHTPLLTRFRANGCACEQTRFRNLHATAKTKL